MPPPTPRCSNWAYSSLISPSHFSLPRYGSRVGLHIDLFEACSAFTRVAACTLVLPPIRDTLIEGFSHFVTSMTALIASGWSDCLCTAHARSVPLLIGRMSDAAKHRNVQPTVIRRVRCAFRGFLLRRWPVRHDRKNLRACSAANSTHRSRWSVHRLGRADTSRS